MAKTNTPKNLKYKSVSGQWYLTGKNLVTKPVRNTTELDTDNAIIRYTVKNIVSRKNFSDGVRFVAKVTNSVHERFPHITRNAAYHHVVRALAKYFN